MNGELREPINPIFFRTSICLLGQPSSNNSKIIKLLSTSIIVSPFFSNSNKILITSYTKFPYFFSLNLKIPKIKLNIWSYWNLSISVVVLVILKKVI